jgi:glycosyltransferase involved in cell wall biosynthesis
MPTEDLIDVSFCLPSYNVARYVESCIDSIITQPFGELTYEIICIDDCSDDDTYKILVELSKKYQQIRVYKNDQYKGVSYTRNKMVDIAKGSYIWFVDPDDMLISGAVSYVSEAQKVNADVLIGNYIRVNEAGEHDFDLSQNDFNNDKIERSEHFAPVDIHGKTMSACWAGVFKREFLVTNNLRFNEKMIAQEDTLFYYQFQMKTKSIYKAKTYCYLYRIRSSSVMHSRSDERMKKYYFSMIEMLRVYREHYDNKDYDNEKLLKDKILHSRQNVTTCLASIQDDSFVREQFKIIKDKKIYPYPLRFKVLRGKENILVKVLRFFLPLGFVFHIYRKVYKQKFKASK